MIFFFLCSYLIISKNSKYIQVCIRSKAQAVHMATDHPRYKSTVTQAIVQCLLIGPICALFDLLEMGVFFIESRIKNSNFDSSTY